jgi:hypothetical protein
VLERPQVLTDRANKIHVSRRSRKEGLQTKIQDITKGLLSIDEQEKRLVKAYSAEVINLSQLKSELADLSAKKDTLSHEERKLEAESVVVAPALQPNDVERYFRSMKERALSASFAMKQEIIRLFAHQVIFNCGQMLITAYLPNPIPDEFPAAHNAHNENLVSTTPQSLEYGGRSVQFTFEIKLDLNRPREIFFDGQPFPQDESSLAA